MTRLHIVLALVACLAVAGVFGGDPKTAVATCACTGCPGNSCAAGTAVCTGSYYGAPSCSGNVFTECFNIGVYQEDVDNSVEFAAMTQECGSVCSALSCSGDTFTTAPIKKASCTCSGCSSGSCGPATTECGYRAGTAVCSGTTFQSCNGIPDDGILAESQAGCNADCASNGCTAGVYTVEGGNNNGGDNSGSSSDKKSKCFPASATVTLEDGSTKTMAQLTIGDSVLVAPSTFSKVYMFSHQLEATKTAFVAVTTAAASLLLTPDHYLYVNGQLAVARTVRVGDRVTLADGTSAAVTKVHTEWASGLYNPHTLHGDIVVNGVQTSTYTQGIAPAVAHAALWPVRALFQAGVAVADSTFAAGAEVVAQLLPNGQATY